MQIYTAQNISSLAWDDYHEGTYARNYLLPLITKGVQKYIANAVCEVQVLAFEKHLFPLVIGSGKVCENSYVCSPYAQYISYAKREMEIEFPGKYWKQKGAKFILNALGLICKYGQFDKVVFVNNWLLSTNLYPNFDLAVLAGLKNLLIQKFPDSTLVFRSVNLLLNQPFYQSLLALNFKDVFSRQVYVIDPEKPDYKSKKSFKIDQKFRLKQAHILWQDAEIEYLTKEDLIRIKKLYDDLYLGKYAKINPQFTLDFIKNAIKNGILKVRILKKEDKIKAVIGYYNRDGVMTNPFVGYDFEASQDEGLYRLLTLESISEAEKLNLIFNMSSGAADFKRTRGAEPALEYNMVYCHHLPKRRQMPWKIFQSLSNSIVIPMMEKYAL